MDMREVVGDAVKSLRVKGTTSSWYTRWIWWILGGGLGLLLIAFLVLEGLQKSRKAARALHKMDVHLESVEIAKVDLVVAENDKKKQLLVVKADKHLRRATDQLQKNVQLTERVEKNQAIIDNLKGWDDVKKRVKY